MTIAACGNTESQADRDQAITAAQTAYTAAKRAGVDFGKGPCIAEHLQGLPGWVVDIAHEPRQAVDNDPANQCRRYRSGDATHLVELTPAGGVIRAE